MTIDEQRAAALANQRAAAFIRFQLINDHEAMHLLLSDIEDSGRIAFVAALGSIAGTVASRFLGEDGAEQYLQTLARASAALSGAME